MLRKKGNRCFRLGFVLPCLFATFLLGCGEKEPTDEEKAQVIYEQAQDYMQQGLELEALREYDKLVEYKDTDVFKKAKAELFEDGIGIGSSLESWTLKRMFALKTEVVEKLKALRPNEDLPRTSHVRDAWGAPILIKYSDSAKYFILIRSAGPDKKFKSDDDLIVHQRDRVGPVPGMDRKSPSRAASPSKADDIPSSPSAPEVDLKKGPTGETVMDIEDLMKKQD